MRRTVSQPRRPAVPAALLAIAILTASCAGGSPGATEAGPRRLVPVVISTDLAVGKNRLLLGRVDSATAEPAAHPPASDLEVALYDLSEDDRVPASVVRARFFWAIEDEYGLFRSNVAFDVAGPWAAELRPRGTETGAPRPRVEFEVREESFTLEPGETAPRTDNRTLADVGGDLTRLTTDPNPTRRLYETSVDGAMGMGVPFVVIFTTPRHCLTDLCLPLLNRVKQVVAGVTSLTVIHVENYRDLDAADPDVLDPALGRWGLTSDTWVFTVNAFGVVRAKFEAAFEPGELFREIQRLYGG